MHEPPSFFGTISYLSNAFDFCSCRKEILKYLFIGVFLPKLPPRKHPGTRASPPGPSHSRVDEPRANRRKHIIHNADCFRTKLVADSPSARPTSPTMLRAGAGHPDADEQLASTSATQSTDQSPDWATLYTTLNEYLQLEHKFQPKLCLPEHSENGEVTTGARDGAAHVLRCLKVWFDLPTDVLIYAINLFDRFLTKMKVRPCHVPCITVSCMNIAIEEHAKTTKIPRPVSIEELVKISQSTCTVGDVERMSRVLTDKLSVADKYMTAAHWVRLLYDILAQCLTAPPKHNTESSLMNLLEIVVCDSSCANTRMSELALVLVYQKLEEELVEWSRVAGSLPDEAYCLYEFAAQLQAHCNMSDSRLVAARGQVRAAVGRYEAPAAAPHRQQLVWRLSERTLKVLRPTERLTSLLPTIVEQNNNQQRHNGRTRSDSSSSESEECSDWPRSPVLPIYCRN